MSAEAYFPSKKFLDSGCVYIAISLSVPILIYQCHCIFFGVWNSSMNSEFIERELEQMTEQIKSFIQTLNANQVNTLSSMFPLLDKFFLTDANN